jgi:hypothetical protein
MKARMDVFREKLDKMDVAMKAGQEKMDTRIETGQEQMEARIKTGLEEMNATESEANERKMESMVEHWVVPNEDATEETIGALEDLFGDQQPAVRCQNPLKR